MRTTAIAALVLAMMTGHAAEPAAEGLTWQEANKRSAALIREKGPSAEAADLARAAFDLYPQQTKSYSAKNHAQLLLNLAGVREKAGGADAALREVDRGVGVIASAAGPKSDVLIAVWQEAARIAGRGSPAAARYSEQAWARAEEILGPGDPRTIDMLLDVVHDRRTTETYAWVVSKLTDARKRAAEMGEDRAQVAEIDLQLAKLLMEDGQQGKAIEAYRALIDRLERRAGHDEEHLLQSAYAHLEYAYEERGDLEAAAEVRRRRHERLLGGASKLVPTLRVSPEYPRSAARDGTQGIVVLQVDVNADGTVANAKVIRSEPPGVFDESALRAVQEWKFQPKIVDGRAVASSGTQQIEYRLEGYRQEFRRGSN